jgi:hypothetical protein
VVLEVSGRLLRLFKDSPVSHCWLTPSFC